MTDSQSQLDQGFQQAVNRYLEAWEQNGLTINPPMQRTEDFFQTPPPIPVNPPPFPPLQPLDAHTVLPPSHLTAAPHPHPSPQTSRCDLCQVSCDTPAQLESHMQGQKHRRQVEWKLAFENAAPNLKAHGIRCVDAVWSCAFCAVNLNGQKAAMQHVEGGRHKRARDSERLRPVLGMTQMQIPMQAEAQVQTPERPLTVLRAAESNRVSGLLGVRSPYVRAVPTGGRGGLKTMAGGGGGGDGGSGGASFPCRVCNVTCNSLESLVLHRSSSKHKRKTAAISFSSPTSTSMSGTEGWSCDECSLGFVSRDSLGEHLRDAHDRAVPDGFTCDICQVTCSAAENLAEHVRSVRHRKREASLKEEGRGGLCCEVCDVTCSAAENLADHLKSVRHRRKVALRDEVARQGEGDGGGDLHCKLCDVSCSAVENYRAHLKGKQHAKKMKMRIEADKAGE